MQMLRRIEPAAPPKVGKQALDAEPVRLPFNANGGLLAGLVVAIAGVVAIVAYYFSL